MFESLAPYSYASAEDERRRVGGERPYRIFFYKVGQSDIASAEARIGFAFPEQLRFFYADIGYGFLSESPVSGLSVGRQYVIPPEMVASLFLLDDPPPLQVPDYGAPRNGFPEGCMPFLDMGDGAFLYLKPSSANPNAVWGVRGHKLICDDLVEFFTKLYVDPWFPVKVEFPDSFDDAGQPRK